MTFPKYPEIEVWRQDSPFDYNKQEEYFGTTIRKQHEGVWYLQDVYFSYRLDPSNIHGTRAWAWQAFQIELYKAMVLGKVDPTLTRKNGFKEQLLFTVDPDQSTEQERLTKQYL